MGEWWKKMSATKTFWAGVGIIVYAGEQFATGAKSLEEAAGYAFLALMGIFMRDGIQKVQAQAEENIKDNPQKVDK